MNGVASFQVSRRVCVCGGGGSHQKPAVKPCRYAKTEINEALKCKPSAHTVSLLYSISDIETSGENWLAGQRFYSEVLLQ